MEGSKDVEEEEETKVTSQRAPSTRRDRGGDLKLSKVENPSSPVKESADKEDSSAPKPRRRRNEATGASTSNSGGGGGWMSTSSGANVINKIAVGMENDEETKEREALKNQNREKHLHDDNDEIMLIPDLDEEGGADSDQRIAHAPRNVNRKIPTLAELESDIKKTAASGSSPDGDGFNLNILLNTLVPSSMVLESDAEWSFESLLREVTDELSNTPKTVISSTTLAIPSSESGSGGGAAAGVGAGANATAGAKGNNTPFPGAKQGTPGGANNNLLSPVSKNKTDKKKV